MLFLDVNVCVYGFRPTMSEEARGVHDWLVGQIDDGQPIGLCELVLSAVVRISTHPRIFEEPATPAAAIEYADSLLDAPSATVLRPGSRHWSIFSAIMTSGRFRANDVTDAYYAALCREQGATMVTRDRGFRRFDDLRILDPLG